VSADDHVNAHLTKLFRHGRLMRIGLNLILVTPVDIHHDRLGALHVHDVDRIRDLHTLPYLGKLNWDDITAALRDVDYTGDFTYEVESFLHPLDDSFIPTALRFMHDVGRHLINKIKQ
jgi:sugar phosphate isomerase/epimerase